MDIGNNFQGGKIACTLQSSDPGYVSGEFHGCSDWFVPYLKTGMVIKIL
jgi:hypothetical protein